MDAAIPLQHWLRLLWGRAPMLALHSAQPFIADGGIHLPARAQWREHCAAAAHAAAHLVYSPARFEGAGLGPIARSLLALLEDARVEALARRELPGLGRLWAPLHTATPADGAGCEALMRRLARALADAAYTDPHPWVAKGRRLFYLDEALGLPALRTPDELRRAATALGHDIGQMRLAFNAKTYRPAPDYRDDHRWMWAADDLAETVPPPPPTAGAGADDDDDPPGAVLARHPEWDRLIGRLRPDWCTVVEASPGPAAPGAALPPALRRLAGQLRGALGPLAHERQRHAGLDGDRFDLEALVPWALDRRLRQPGDARVYRHDRPRRAAHAAVWLLVDQSASSASAPGDGDSALQLACDAAAATALALQALGVRCAVAAFSSCGRHALHWRTVKGWHEAADGGWAARLPALRAGGSTRLGAALRHATAGLAAQRGGPHWVLLLSDGQAHDVDVHDARYLPEDARQAVRSAGRRAVRMACVSLAGDGDGAAAAQIFGRRGALGLQRLDELPRLVQRLLA